MTWLTQFFAVANEFIKDKELPVLTPMKIQKLIYYANLWYVEATNQPIVDEPFCRWRFGPVVPSLYHQLKNYGDKPVTNLLRWTDINDETGDVNFFTPYISPQDINAISCIEQIKRKYGSYTGTQLSNLSHRDGSAWSISRQEDGKICSETRTIADGSTISIADMKHEAQKLLRNRTANA